MDGFPTAGREVERHRAAAERICGLLVDLGEPIEPVATGQRGPARRRRTCGRRTSDSVVRIVGQPVSV
jgi:hypothetical protein